MRLISLPFDELVSRGVSASFAKILTDPDSYHPDLDILIGKTNWDYFIPDGVTDIVPLWDSNADSFVRWTRNGETEYVWLFHDDPKYILVARSEQGIMAKLCQQWSEFQETEDECRRFANTIGFKYIDELLAIWDEDNDKISQWRRNISD